MCQVRKGERGGTPQPFLILGSLPPRLKPNFCFVREA
jgi:hypothetical protein